MPVPDPGRLLAGTLDGLTLTILLATTVAAVLVGRDARQRGLSRRRAVGWALLTFVVLPIGASLYLLLGRSTRDHPEE